MKKTTVVVGGAVLLVVGVLLVGVVSAGIWWYWTRTPQYSLRQVGQAIRTHDLVLFEKHVDLDSVTSTFIDAMLVGEPAPPADNAWEQAGRSLGQGLAVLVKPRLAREMKSRIIEAVERPVQGERPLTYVATEGIDLQGKQAIATLRFSTRSGPLVLKLRMRNLGSYWQIAEIANAADLRQEQRKELFGK